ncbi:hypothetical protein [Lysinibacillus fusiformis]|uniref:hypothetical protein n=1 Tax=Lysinibacillus fusiformis TaxID=28031 RepID=UPI00263BE5F0|nr:hypothetical protein [Lysinibacillus fusiformis]MDC6267269.1 hypothetical protein [Lysinibacillus sphaericus]MDN4968297.1 hypothetical protein [Lysinibacillus fusiformis]MDN4968471.1 hypothetical protein [Lysinibacillus fusiformis]
MNHLNQLQVLEEESLKQENVINSISLIINDYYMAGNISSEGVIEEINPILKKYYEDKFDKN